MVKGIIEILYENYSMVSLTQRKCRFAFLAQATG